MFVLLGVIVLDVLVLEVVAAYYTIPTMSWFDAKSVSRA